MKSVSALLLVLAAFAIPDRLLAQADTVWTPYKVHPAIDTRNLTSRDLFNHGRKQAIRDNVAEFYLYRNGELVKPDSNRISHDFFPAGCLCFKQDDTLLLNSGIGRLQGVGVGIKIVQGKFTSTLHANSKNKPVFKLAKDDTAYCSDVTAAPEKQSLKLYRSPAFSANELLIGEYRATYRTFFQKAREHDEIRRYTVRIVFKCRVTGMDTIKFMTGYQPSSTPAANP